MDNVGILLLHEERQACFLRSLIALIAIIENVQYRYCICKHTDVSLYLGLLLLFGAHGDSYKLRITHSQRLIHRFIHIFSFRIALPLKLRRLSSHENYQMLPKPMLRFILLIHQPLP